ncbi:unnamed protein product [Arctogadus glacialis]
MDGREPHNTVGPMLLVTWTVSKDHKSRRNPAPGRATIEPRYSQCPCFITSSCSPGGVRGHLPVMSQQTRLDL